ncbi:putative nascent polypeptide-associated complex subunit alpha [Medicago truncatula]|nr:putative nascent polypeptide-associated complex subunit alpha [Medicago truncatula]
MLLKSGLRPLNIDLSLSSDDDTCSSVVSTNVGCETPLSSWDFEPEIDINLEENYVDVEEQNDMDNRSYDDLIKKIIGTEEELRVTNSKLRLSEEENIKLKVQVGNGEGQLDNVSEELNLKKKELRKQKELLEEFNLKDEELQKQTAKLSTHIPEYIPEYVSNITNLVKQLEVASKKLKISKVEIESLRNELRSKSHETHQLQGQLKVALENMAKSELELVSERKKSQMLGDLVTVYEDNETKHKQDVQKLNSEMLDLQAKFSLEKDELNFDIASLSKMKIQLTSKLEYCESINKELENKLRKYEAENLKQEMHATQQMVLQDEISSLRELGQRIHDIEDTNRELDMVMIERDEADVKIDKLKIEICSCDDQITNTKTYIRELKASLKEQVIKRTKNIMFFISKLDVIKSSNSDTYIMFEEAKKEDLMNSHQLQTQAAQEQGAGADGAQPEEEEEVDETGMQAQNIEMVMIQAGVSRSKAVKALKTYNGDIVDAMLELINFDL